MSSRRSLLIAVSAFLWLGGVAAGFAALERYAAQAGEIRPATGMTAFFAAHRAPGRPLLVMALHPRCPCSEASLAELGEILLRHRGQCDALILQFQPEQDLAGWGYPAKHHMLNGIAVPVLPDRGGSLAASLGAVTSGHVFLADARGVVRFSGGITPRRGHRGPTASHEAITAVLSGGRADIASAPIYGCALAPECAAPLPSS